MHFMEELLNALDKTVELGPEKGIDEETIVNAKKFADIIRSKKKEPSPKEGIKSE